MPMVDADNVEAELESLRKDLDAAEYPCEHRKNRPCTACLSARIDDLFSRRGQTIIDALRLGMLAALLSSRITAVTRTTPSRTVMT